MHGPHANEAHNASAQSQLAELEVAGNTYAPEPAVIVGADGTVLVRTYVGREAPTRLFESCLVTW